MPDPELSAPSNPESSPEATQRLPIGVPEDPQRTQRMELPKHLSAHSTQQLPIQPAAADLGQTQKLLRPLGEEAPIRWQKVDLPAEAEGQTQKLDLRPQTARSWGLKLPVGLGALAVLGAVAVILIIRQPAPQPIISPLAKTQSQPETEAVPPAAKVYFDQAQAGDAHAMRMLGAMYYYGLNVPQDRDKGRLWYRRAAEKGSDAARSELTKIEGGR